MRLGYWEGFTWITRKKLLRLLKKLKAKRFYVIFIFFWLTFLESIGGRYMFGKRKKIKPYRINTTQKGFEYIGIKLTDEQFQDLVALNMLWIGNEKRRESPVFHILILMKILGLLPPEMICKESNQKTDDNTDKDVYQALERKFGKIIR